MSIDHAAPGTDQPGAYRPGRTGAAPAEGQPGARLVTALEEHRAVLTGHCYRMLGSLADADDAVQETMVRAWRGLAQASTGAPRCAPGCTASPPASASTRWTTAARRARPMEEGPAGDVDDPLAERERSHWLEPMPDAVALPRDADPAEAAVLRQSIRLAFVAALQHLPPRQRAALLLDRGARLLGRRGGREPRHLGALGEQRPPAGARHAGPARRRGATSGAGAALQRAGAAPRALRRGLRPLRRGRPHLAAPRGRDLLDAPLRAVAARPRGGAGLAARAAAPAAAAPACCRWRPVARPRSRSTARARAEATSRGR